MLAAIIGLFVVSTLAVVTDVEYYLVQFPSALGTSSEDIQALMNGLDIVGVVTVRLSVRQAIYDFHLLIFTHFTVRRQRCNRRLASMDHMAGLPPYTMGATAMHMRKYRCAAEI